jgi:hypothetical protein
LWLDACRTNALAAAGAIVSLALVSAPVPLGILRAGAFGSELFDQGRLIPAAVSVRLLQSGSMMIPVRIRMAGIPL